MLGVWGSMGEEYRVSSSVKVEQLEAELSRQLSALKELIGKRGVEQTRDSGTYRCAAVIFKSSTRSLGWQTGSVSVSALSVLFLLLFMRGSTFFNNENSCKVGY